MKIINSEIKIPRINELSSEYFEVEFEKRGLKVIRWAIVAHESNDFVVNVSYCEH